MVVETDLCVRMIHDLVGALAPIEHLLPSAWAVLICSNIDISNELHGRVRFDSRELASIITNLLLT